MHKVWPLGQARPKTLLTTRCFTFAMCGGCCCCVLPTIRLVFGVKYCIRYTFAVASCVSGPFNQFTFSQFCVQMEIWSFVWRYSLVHFKNTHTKAHTYADIPFCVPPFPGRNCLNSNPKSGWQCGPKPPAASGRRNSSIHMHMNSRIM